MRSVRVVVVFVLGSFLLASAGLGLALLLAPAPVTSQPEATSRETGYVRGWGRPVWRDEFNGPSLDRGKWNVRDADHVSYDVGSIHARQAFVRDGALVLRAERVDPRQDAFGNSWATGYVDTIGGKFSQRYGRFEMSAKLPTSPGDSRGLWPSFWLRDDRGPGEIDVMEAWGTPSARPAEDEPGSYTWTVHRDTYDGSQQFSDTARPEPGPSLSEGFHRYAAEWTPSGVRFFLDGALVGTLKTSDHPWLTTSFPSKVNIRLQLAVGGDYWGRPDGRTKSPADYVIDYVRVWAYPGR